MNGKFGNITCTADIVNRKIIIDAIINKDIYMKYKDIFFKFKKSDKGYRYEYNF